DDVADLVPGLDVPVGLDDPLQGEAPIDHRAEPSIGDAFAQVLDDLLGLDRERKHHPTTTTEPCCQRQNEFWDQGPRSVVRKRPPSAPGATSPNDRPAGIGATMPCSGTHTSSACAPNLGLYPNTRSPSENLVTPGPTASTTPANSLPRIVARGWTRPVNARMK